MSSVRGVQSFSARLRRSSPARSGFLTLALLLTSATGCADDAAEPTVSTPNGPRVPASLEGVWLLEGTDLFLDIRLTTATVDGRTGCARLLGSLTAGADGDPTSFSLPGRDTTGCTLSEARTADRLVMLLESAAAARAEPGGYVLLDDTENEIGRLLIGS